jgi:hypothetical protein
MMCEDGQKVTDHFATYDCAETFMRLTRPLASLCYWWWYARYSEIMRDANGELYLYSYHRNVGYSDYYYRFRSAQDLAAVIFDLDEYQILEFPETGSLGGKLAQGRPRRNLENALQSPGQDCRTVVPPAYRGC